MIKKIIFNVCFLKASKEIENWYFATSVIIILPNCLFFYQNCFECTQQQYIKLPVMFLVQDLSMIFKKIFNMFLGLGFLKHLVDNALLERAITLFP